MSSISEEMGEESGDMEDLDLDDFDDMEELDIDGIGEESQGIESKIKDIFLKDTSGKSLDRYDLADYSFMPDSQGSKRILRAIDYGIGGLDMVISDLVIGLAQISKDMNGGA